MVKEKSFRRDPVTRAKAADYRSHDEVGSLCEPGLVEEIEHEGKRYVRLSNVNGVLATYRIRTYGALKSLIRWPAALER